MNFRTENELSLENFQQMSRLEMKYYGSEFITPPEEAYLWYKKYSYTAEAVFDGENMAGFINLFPVKENVFEKIKAGGFNDKNMTLEDIEDIKEKSGKELNMFLCCIVVDDKYRKKGVTGLLLRAACDKYRKVMHRCRWIVTDNVTEEGEHFSKGMGFSLACLSDHGSKIYMQSFESFLREIGY